MNGLEFYIERPFRPLNIDNTILNGNLERAYNDFVLSNRERVIYDCFSSFKKRGSNDNFAGFQESYVKSNGTLINQDYPMASEIFHLQESKLQNLVSSIVERFSCDKSSLIKTGILPENVELVNMQVGMGDFHNGQSTTILELNDGSRLIYKPNSCALSEAYHQLLNWINEYLDFGDPTYQVLDRKVYHWQEFINFSPVESEEELIKYYSRAGITACLTYILNAVDFHFENLIVSKASPVLIDHETIIQARGSEKYSEFFNIYEFPNVESVLDSMLFPNQMGKTGMPKGLCGFGYAQNTSNSGWQRVSVNPFSDDWKYTTRFIKRHFYKYNIPEYQGKRIYPEQYIKHILAGFDACYRLFMDKKSFLVDDDCALLNGFENKPVRFIWRGTNVYAKILDYMKLPKNLKDKNTYRQKIREYLSKAFKNVPSTSELQLILESELMDMYRGDIPYFEINSSSRNLKTKAGEIAGFFELSCVENIRRKLKKLSEEDLSSQKSLIIESYELDEKISSTKNKKKREALPISNS